jgi:inorganic triphosphatase YgiF
MTEIQQEIESKFDVAPDFIVGDLAGLLYEGDTVEVSDHELVSVYYDTDQHDLLRSRLTLRRRTGTSDTGWHLKVPGKDARTELRWPLSGHDELPEELRRLIAPFSHGNPLHATVRLRVARTRHRVQDESGRLRFEVADDQVRADGLSAAVESPRWHEVEVELGPAGEPEDLLEAADYLNARGAFGSPSPSKLMRALHGLPVEAGQPRTAAAVLGDYLAEQCDAITAGHFAIATMPFDPDATAEPHEAVHRTRVACRRFRAVIRVFGELFDPVRASRLAAELQWYGAELGEIRDREVLRVRLGRAVDLLPAFLVVGPVAQRIDELLLGELHEHADSLLHTMLESRYHELVDELAEWRDSAPFTEAAMQPADVLADYVAAAERTLTKRMKRAGSRRASDEQLHSARKAGKRARYAAEASAPVLGRHAGQLAKTASHLQTLLGEHQDAVVATAVLRRIADQVADEGDNAFTYGLLVADQRRYASDAAAGAPEAARS